MWRWDQGRLAYFQFDALRAIAAFAEENDFGKADRTTVEVATGLPFLAPKNYLPWRNYSRALKLALLMSVDKRVVRPTPVSSILSKPGAVTCDEYLHFLVCATTDPSPALRGWQCNAAFRYPLLFALKFVLAKAATQDAAVASIDEIIGAYQISKFDGTEDQTRFISAVRSATNYDAIGKQVPFNSRRQARESLLVISQISYLHVRDDEIIVSLHREDATSIFDELQPILGPRKRNREAEIRRIAALFRDGSTSTAFDYPKTIIDDVLESGFREGNRIKKTHITIERNAGLRNHFFATRPSPTCDFCLTQTAESYPWTERILDIHHLLPLCSGTRVEEHSTTFDDLVPVCPSCHRAIHRYYDGWLGRENRMDFTNGREARMVYEQAKSIFPGLIHA